MNWFAVTYLGLIACGPTVDLGRDPDLLWWSTFESGDTSDLSALPPGAGFVDTYGGASLAIESGIGRDGLHAARLRLPAATECCVGARLVREGAMPLAGYYSAWVRFVGDVAPMSYWSVMKLTDIGSERRDDLQMFDVLVQRTEGSLSVSLYVHSLGGRPALTAKPLQALPIALGAWVHLELFLKQSTDGTGLVRLWKDGTLAAEVQGPTTFAQAQVRRFTVASVSERNPPLEIVADDMAISLRRLGPETALRESVQGHR